jgi:hypothetical protein
VPLAWTAGRVVTVLAVAIGCTRILGLGEQAVFTTIALGNLASAGALVVLFVAAERRLAAAQDNIPAELAATGTR